MKLKGYVALTTVVVIIPLLLLAGIDSIYNNITSLLVGRMSYDYQILKNNSETCLEESIYKIKWNPTYTGVLSIDMEDWSCTSTITDKDGESGVKVINMELLDSNNVTMTVSKELNTNTNPFELSNI